MAGTGRNSISFCSYILPFREKLPTSECPYLIFAARLRNIFHAKFSEFAELCERGGFVIAALVGGGEFFGIFGDYVIFEFAHGLKFVACGILKSVASFAKGIFGRAFRAAFRPY